MSDAKPDDLSRLETPASAAPAPPVAPAGTEPAVAIVCARPISLASRWWHFIGRPPLDLSPLSVRAAWLDLALIVVLALVVGLGPTLAFALAKEGALTDHFTPVTTIIAQAFRALEVVALLAYMVYRHGLPASAFGLSRRGLAGQIGWSVPILASHYFVSLLLLIPITICLLLFPALQSDLKHRIEFMRALPIDSLPLTVALMIPVAVHEEVLFRGLLLPYLRRLTGSWVGAIAVSTLVFAALHFTQGWLGVIQVIPIGAVLATAFVLTRSLLAVILAHCAFNILQTQFMRLMQEHLEQFAPEAAAFL